MAIFVIVSGIVPALTHWSDDSPIQREVFINVPTPVKVAFYASVATMLLIVAWLASLRVRNYERGQPDDRRTTRKNVERRMRDFRSGVWMQTLLRDPAAGIMHSFLYFGFVVLFIATVISEADHQMPDALKFLHGRTYEAYSAGADLAGVVFLIGVSWAIVRRYVQRPYRIRIKTKPEDAFILGTLFLIGVTGFLVEGARIAFEQRPGYEKWSFVGYPLVGLVDTWSTDTLLNLHKWMWVDPRRRVPRFPRDDPDDEAAAHVHVTDEHVPEGPRPPQGRDEADAEPHGDRSRELRRGEDRGLHVEAAVRHRRVHDLRPVHVGVPCARDRQAARPARDRAEGRRGHGRDRRPDGLAAGRHGSRHHDRRRQRVRAHHLRRAVGVHELQGVRRDLPGEHRDPRQDPRHAPLPHADGERLPDRARQHVPLDGELGQRVRHEPGRARRLGGVGGRRRDRRARRRVRPRVPLLRRVRGQLRRPQQEDGTRARRSCCSAPASTSRSSDRARCATATRRDARATSTSSRCSPCRTSRRSTTWA